ncbi:MAG TPA: alpha/beta hydrolase [Candidatus Binatia bacterium]|nr:alpha/beta hydrolase [Candidatus Binatia bacterium]
MEKFFSASFLLSAVLTVILAFPGYAHSQWHPACQEGSLPSHDPKYPADQLIITCIPPNWNGQLVLYAHGYVPPQFALALPVDELTVDGTFVPNVLLAQGFAFATTSFHKNGVAIEQGGEDLNKLLQYFKSLVPPGSLGKVYLVGGSEGGLIALRLFERFQGKYDGAVALCAPVGGSADFIKYAYDFRVVFDYFFPMVFTFPPNQAGEQPFGAIDVPQAAFQFWESVYVPRIIAALSGNPLATAQLFNVTKAAIDPSDPTSVVETAVPLLSYGIFGANDLIATSGGVPYDNRTTTYVGSADDAALNAGVERIQSDGRARAYAKRFYEPIGNLHDPLVTLHNVLDPLVPFQQEIEYQGLVTKKKSAFLTVLPVARYGHCDFTAGEVIDAFSLMIQQAGGQLLN